MRIFIFKVLLDAKQQLSDLRTIPQHPVSPMHAGSTALSAGFSMAALSPAHHIGAAPLPPVRPGSGTGVQPQPSPRHLSANAALLQTKIMNNPARD